MAVPALASLAHFSHSNSVNRSQSQQDAAVSVVNNNTKNKQNNLFYFDHNNNKYNSSSNSSSHKSGKSNQEIDSQRHQNHWSLLHRARTSVKELSLGGTLTKHGWQDTFKLAGSRNGSIRRGGQRGMTVSRTFIFAFCYLIYV